MATATDLKLDSRQRLLAAARALLWANSYGAVSVDDICAQAAVNKGSFYHHFPSKLELTKAAFDAHWHEIRPHLDALFSPQVAPLDRLTGYLQMARQLQGDKHAECGRVLGCPYTTLGCETAADAGFREVAALQVERTCRYFAAAIRDAQREGLVATELDAEALAHQLQAFITGTMAQARIANSLTSLDQLDAGVRRLLGARG